MDGGVSRGSTQYGFKYMINNTIAIRHLSFTGPNRPKACITFNQGLNVLYGASETGKSFVLEAIDFMLGGRDLRDIPERVGYDRVFLGIETSNGEKFTLVRSTSGGAFTLFDNLFEELPDDSVPRMDLIATHNAKNENNISTFLLNEIGLAQSKLKSNARGETKNLSFRNLSHLCLVDEGNILKKHSPIEDGIPTQRTLEYSLFKLLLTGVDDSSFNTLPKTIIQARAASIEAIDGLLKEFKSQLDQENSASEAELSDQLERLEITILQEQAIVKVNEEAYQALATELSKLRGQIQNGIERRAEINELLARFALLDKHYLSDIARLDGIREAGALIASLDKVSCPLCGAHPEQQHVETDCVGNVQNVAIAANAESEKIIRLRLELEQTVSQLRSEAASFDRLLPKIKDKVILVEQEMQSIQPQISGKRESYVDLIETRSQIKDTLKIWSLTAELSTRKERLVSESAADKIIEKHKVDLSSDTLDQFAQMVEKILKTWEVPDSERVYFDETTKDVVISGKRRGDRGKGMRSITHAAFNIALLEFCRNKDRPHPGFVILDSPLLAYREPEDSADDLRETNVQEMFYNYLVNITDRQIIIIENIDPPIEIKQLPTSIMFSKNDAQGRYGLFPIS